jgi:hypothetical protein
MLGGRFDTAATSGVAKRPSLIGCGAMQARLSRTSLH